MGPNGVGKSSLLSAIGQRELAIPAHIDIYHLVKEVDPSERRVAGGVQHIGLCATRDRTHSTIDAPMGGCLRRSPARSAVG